MNSVNSMDSNKKVSFFVIPRLFKIAPIALYLLIVLLFLPRFSEDMSVDGVSYMEIARLYLSGNWQDAVNGYWSPLISWILAPLLGVGLSPNIAFKAITISSGLLALAANGTLVANCIRNRRIVLIVQCSSAAMFASFSMVVCSPDIIGLAFFLTFIATMIQSLKTKRNVCLLISGASITASYFSKTFFLPFCICVAFLLPSIGFALHRSKVKFRRDIFTSITICSIALMLAIPWLIVLNSKYGEWTIGTSGKFNLGLVMNQVSASRVLAPQTAISPFQDPTISALSSHTKVRLDRVVLNLVRNIEGLVIRTMRHYPFAVVSVLLTVVSFRRSRRLYWRNPIVIGIPILVIWCAYSAVCSFVPQQAYVWLGDVLLLVVMAIGLEQSSTLLLCRGSFSRLMLTTILLLLWSSYPIAEMLVRHAQGVREKESGISLNKLVKGKIVISDSLHNETLVASFWASARYRGQFPNKVRLVDINDADYFLRWNKHSAIPEGFNRVDNLNVALGPVEVWERNR